MSGKTDKPMRILTLRLPRLVLVIGLIGLAFFIFCLIGTITSVDYSNYWWLYPGFILFVLLGLSLIVSYFNLRIYAYSDFFIIKNFFGIKHRIEYANVTKVEYSESIVRIFTPERHYSYLPLTGFPEFLKTMLEKWPGASSE